MQTHNNKDTSVSTHLVKARLVIVNVELAAPAISSLLSPLELYFSPIRFLNCCRNLITVGIKINEKKCSMHEQTGIYGKSRKLFISIRSTNLSPIQIKQSFAKGADEKSLLLLFITSPPRETNYVRKLMQLLISSASSYINTMFSSYCWLITVSFSHQSSLYRAALPRIPSPTKIRLRRRSRFYPFRNGTGNECKLGLVCPPHARQPSS